MADLCATKTRRYTSSDLCQNWRKCFIPQPGNHLKKKNRESLFTCILKAVMNMEWRSEYEIQVGDKSPKAELSVDISTPSSSWSKWGIYNHFETIVTGRTIRIVPRFLFGLHVETIESIYGAEDTVAKIPIVGVFTESPNLDRIIIQTYMNIVTLSVIFLLWANNPPNTLVGK